MNGWKWLKLVGLGLVIWGLSLVWPEVNLILTQPPVISRALERGVATLGYIFD